MNCCGRPAVYVVAGAVESVTGEPILAVLGACDRHVMATKQFLQEWEEVTGEPVIVCGVEAWVNANWQAVGPDVRAMIESPGRLVKAG